ncbi:unnamed protein product, partial [marine sediment metagenome]
NDIKLRQHVIDALGENSFCFHVESSPSPRDVVIGKVTISRELTHSLAPGPGYWGWNRTKCGYLTNYLRYYENSIK